MIALVVVIGLVALLGATFIGTRLIERGYPPMGHFVEVDGGRLHVVEMGAPDAPPVLLLHGASGNLGDLKLALGDRLAERYRVILIDRPGHGWSDRPQGDAGASPATQAALIHQAMTRIGVRRPIVLGHSWSGALATAYALAFPDDVGGLVLLAPVTHRWPGGIGAINHVIAAPLIGPLIAYTLIMPSGYLLLAPGTNSVFAPQAPPPDYAARTGVAMLLRPREFIANARDLDVLKECVTRQSPRYGEIKVPVSIVAGDRDPIVYTDVHSRAIARQLPQARLTVLPGIGHMVHYAAPDEVIRAVDEVAARAQ